MNLLFRWLKILWLSLRQPSRSYNENFSSIYRVGLHDLGWRAHLPNYRFLSFMELGAYHFFFATRLCFSKRYSHRMISAQQVIYLNPIGPFKKFKKNTQLMGWDEKYFYFRHDFYIEDQLMAVGLVKEVCLKNMKVVPPKKILGVEGTSHPVIESWLINQADIRSLFAEKQG